MRSLPRAPAHLVREAREGASWATEICIASSTSRVLPSLASQARRPPHVRRAEAMDGIQYATYYNRAIAMQITVPVGHKTAPSSSGIGQYREPSAWQRAEQTLMDNNWYCDMACEGCLRPSGNAPEPVRPYNLWSCTECDFAICDVCHSTSEHVHPHMLRLHRHMPWV